MKTQWATGTRGGSAGVPAAVPGVAIGVLAAGFWLVYGVSRGATAFGDSASYLAAADALSRGATVATMRTPGYPLFIAACRGMAALLGVNDLRLLVVAQVILCAGLSTYLVYDIGLRLTERRSVGAIAGLMMAADVDLQHFTSAILSESLSVAVAVASLWLRCRDRGWRRAGWLLAVLVLIRPIFIFVPVAFAACELIRTRRIRPSVYALAPMCVVTCVWAMSSALWGGSPVAVRQYFAPLHAFGKVYESKLWREIPDAGEREIVAEAKRRGLDVYQAAKSVADAEGGSSGLASVSAHVIHADPLGYLAVCVGVVPREFRQGTYWPRGLQSWGRNPHWSERFSWMAHWWEPLYHATFYRSFALFLALLAVACVNGLGWPGAVSMMRDTFVPFVVVLFLSVAMLSLGTEEVGRLAVASHPINGLLWALVSVRTWEMLRSLPVTPIRASQPV